MVFTFGIAAVVLCAFGIAIFAPGLRTFLAHRSHGAISAAGLGNLIDRVVQDGYVTRLSER